MPDFRSLDRPIKELESHLTLQSYIVGYALTLADVADLQSGVLFTETKWQPPSVGTAST